jgi:transcriptional regulator with XRE-family HTH domain
VEVDRNLIGKRVKEARLSENPKVTQKDFLARLELEGLKLDVTAISKIETGSRHVNLYYGDCHNPYKCNCRLLCAVEICLSLNLTLQRFHIDLS